MNIFVPKHYEMDPSTETLLRGAELKNGMRVLREDHSVRENPNQMWQDDEDEALIRARLMAYNRWCTVTNLYWNEGATLGTFVGLYEDGIMASHVLTEFKYWFVKRDSISVPPPSATKKLETQDEYSFNRWAVLPEIQGNLIEETPKPQFLRIPHPRIKDQYLSYPIAPEPVETDWTQQNPHGAGSPEDDTQELPTRLEKLPGLEAFGINPDNPWGISKRIPLALTEEQKKFLEENAKKNSLRREAPELRTMLKADLEVESTVGLEEDAANDVSDNVRDLTEVAKRIRDEQAGKDS